MKAKFSFLTIVLLFSVTTTFAGTYSIEAFEYSMPQIADYVGEDPVGDRGDTIAQIGNEQTKNVFRADWLLY